MSDPLKGERERFLATLEVSRRELIHVRRSRDYLAAQAIDPAWVTALDEDFAEADRLEAFVSRYGRLQDTIGGKLIPRALSAVAEEPGTMLDNLIRAERLGWVESEERWLAARELRNRLVHEYVTDPARFAADIHAALENVPLFEYAYRALLCMAERQFGVAEAELARFLEEGTPDS